MESLKKSWKSWTIWFGSLVTGAALFLPSVEAELPALKEYLPDDAYKTLSLVAGVGIILLRIKTKSSLSDK